MQKKILSLFALFLTLNVFATPASTPPLPPPGWIDVYDITSTTATVEWENVGAGAWYKVTLRETQSGNMVDLDFTQNTTLEYTDLNPGTEYTVEVQASTNPMGPYGPIFSEKFNTWVIIVDNVINLTPSTTPDQQNPVKFGQVNGNQPAGTNQFFICLPMVNLGPNYNQVEDAFHGYITAPAPNSNDFFEFAMVATNSYEIILPYDGFGGSQGYIAYTTGSNIWQVIYFDENDEPVNPNGGQGGVVSVLVKYGEPGGVMNEMLSLSAKEYPNVAGHFPMDVWVYNPGAFFGANNNCYVDTNPCDGGQTNKFGGIKQFEIQPIQEFTSASNPVFPNPFTEVLNISIPQDSRSVRILNASGQLQFESTSLTQGVDQYQLETSEWGNGIYFIHIQNADGVSVYPIIKH
jgi:hypothetical protein